MSKRRKGRKGGRGGPRPSSSLHEHVRDGSLLRPPIKEAAGEGLMAVPWLQLVLPDMLWVCGLLLDDETAGRAIFVRTLDAVTEVLATCEIEGTVAPDPKRVIDGRLTSFEDVPEAARSGVLERLAQLDLLDLALSDRHVNAMRNYPGAPGYWLVTARLDAVKEDVADAEDYLASLIATAAHGQDPLPTMAKILVHRAYFVAGKVHIPPGEKFNLLRDGLPRWPERLEPDEREQLESVMRAMFMGLVPLFEHEAAYPMSSWAREFWRQNWSLYPCRVGEPAGSPETDDAMSEVVQLLVAGWQDQWTRLQSAAAEADPDLYEPDRYEVLTGISARAVKLAGVVVGSPVLWSGEFGGPLARAVVEALVIIRWLVGQERATPELYSNFKDYGRGRLKLYKLHLEAEVQSLGDSAPESVRHQLEELIAAVNQDTPEALQDIDLSGSFSKKDLRKMAIEVGMKREYDTMLAPASSATHGEWPALDRYALRQCSNPLHRWHRILRADGALAFGPGLAETVLVVATQIVDAYARSIPRTPS